MDQFIKQLAEQGDLSWIEITNRVKEFSPRFRGYTPKMVRERYKNYLMPGLERRPWTIEDDRQLIELVHENTFDWASVIASINGRSELDIKNRYFGILEPMEKKAAKKAIIVLRKRKQNPLTD